DQDNAALVLGHDPATDVVQFLLAQLAISLSDLNNPFHVASPVPVPESTIVSVIATMPHQPQRRCSTRDRFRRDLALCDRPHIRGITGRRLRKRKTRRCPVRQRRMPVDDKQGARRPTHCRGAPCGRPASAKRATTRVAPTFHVRLQSGDARTRQLRPSTHVCALVRYATSAPTAAAAPEYQCCLFSTRRRRRSRSRSPSFS